MKVKEKKPLDPMVVGGLSLNTLSLGLRQVSAVPHFVCLMLSLAAPACYGVYIARRGKPQ